jgi:hypothetical protein
METRGTEPLYRGIDRSGPLRTGSRHRLVRLLCPHTSLSRLPLRLVTVLLPLRVLASGRRSKKEALKRRDKAIAACRLLDKDVAHIRRLRHAAVDHERDASIREFIAQIFAAIAQHEVQHCDRHILRGCRFQRLSACAPASARL